ncbi:MAG: DNA polymerase III subunit alpha, partial [bacterium]
MVSDFVHLHVHTDYSLLRASGTIKDYVSRAAELGMHSLAITDTGNMFGALEFYNACNDAGIRPIIGTEVHLAEGSRHARESSDRRGRYARIVLLAQSNTGYRNLMAISSASFTEGFYYKPRVDDELLEQYSEDVICLSGSIAGDIPSLILNNRTDEARARARRYVEIFGVSNFYLELTDHGIPEQRTVNAELIKISSELQIPLAAANDCQYVRRDDANAHDILLCIGAGAEKHDTNRPRMRGAEYFLKSSDELARSFTSVPADIRERAFANTVTIAESCNVEIPQPGPLLPEYDVPAEFEGPEAYLHHLTHEGLKARYETMTDEIRERAEFELSTITGMDYTGYFLIVWDFIRYARDNDIPVGPGRGSGAGSIVAYALEITDIDPLSYGLLFERFLNPDRVSMPDFDIDFCFERRSEVIDYVTRKYGSDRVGQIITFGTLKAKAVVRDVARALGLPPAEGDRVSKLIPGGPKVTLSGALKDEPDLRKLYESGGVYRELIDTGLKLEGLHRHASTHAAGVVIGKDTLTEYVPLYLDSRTGSISTQYTMDQIEPCGLVKMDFLGLKTLTLIRNTEKLIRSHQPDFDIEKVSTNDPATFRMLGEGRSASVFQFESQGMRDILTRAQPESISDLIALNALYRPGPMENIPQFIESKFDRSKIRFPHESLKEELEETYGVIVYQEQVMQIVRIIAGFSLGQADLLRRAMGKKKEKEMARMKVDFLEGAERRGIGKQKAEEIFTLLEPFAGYGFNKSHAAAYSIVAYKTAYLKANFPAEFMAANLTNEINSPDKFAEYLAEARSMGIEVAAPDINLSGKYFTVVEGRIRFGLVGIKGVGAGAVDAILAEREAGGPFEGLVDFLSRVDMRAANRKVIEVLISVGVFDSIDGRRRSLLENLGRALEFASAQRANRESGQTSLFDAESDESVNTFELQPVEEWSATERLAYEREALGFYASGHPLDDYLEQWERCATVSTAEFSECAQDSEQLIVGLLTDIREVPTRRGSRMAFGTVEDYSGSVEVVLFSEALETERQRLVPETVLGFSGTADFRRDRTQLVVHRVREPRELPERGISEIHIRLDGVNPNEESLCELRSVLIDNHGPCPVYLHVASGDGEDERIVRASGQLGISSKAATLERIADTGIVRDVWKEKTASTGRAESG